MPASPPVQWALVALGRAFFTARMPKTCKNDKHTSLLEKNCFRLGTTAHPSLAWYVTEFLDMLIVALIDERLGSANANKRLNVVRYLSRFTNDNSRSGWFIFSFPFLLSNRQYDQELSPMNFAP